MYRTKSRPQRQSKLRWLISVAFGFGQLGLFEEIGSSAIVDQFNTNVFGLFNVTRAVIPAMRKQRSGHILNVSSIGGSVGFAGSTVYCATKYAVEGFSESLALEVADFGINVLIVAPGFVRTDFLDSSSVRYGDKTPKSPQISAPPTTATATNKPAIPRNWPARL